MISGTTLILLGMVVGTTLTGIAVGNTEGDALVTAALLWACFFLALIVETWPKFTKRPAPGVNEGTVSYTHLTLPTNREV